MRTVAALQRTLQRGLQVCCCTAPLQQLPDVWLAQMRPITPRTLLFSSSMQQLSGTAAASSRALARAFLAPRQLLQLHCSPAASSRQHIPAAVRCRSVAGLRSYSTSSSSAVPLVVIPVESSKSGAGPGQLQQLHSGTAHPRNPAVTSNGRGLGHVPASTANGSSSSRAKPSSPALQEQQDPCVLARGQQLLSGEQQLQQQQLPQEVLLIGVDPDTSGAIAVVHAPLQWVASSSASSNTHTSGTSSSNGSKSRSRSAAAAAGTVSTVKNSSSNGSRRSRRCLSSSGDSRTNNGSSATTNSSIGSIVPTINSSSSSAAEAPQLQAYMCLPDAVVRVYDMPVETIVTKSKTRTGKRRVRRRLDILQAMAIIRQVLQDAAETAAVAPTPPAGTDSPSSSSISSRTAADTDTPSCSSNSSRSSDGSSRCVLLRAVVEVASIQPSNGSLATLNQGYSLGAWTALLPAHGFDVTTVHVLSWKKDFGLLRQGKDSSRDVARQLFAQAGAPQDDLLRTKNTHGRAEALLLAAWGLGWSADAGTLSPSQGPLRAPLSMDGGQHVLQQQPQRQQQQGQRQGQQQGQWSGSSNTAAEAAAAGVVTSDDDSPESLLCQPSVMAAPWAALQVAGAVTRASLATQLQAFALQQQPQRAPVPDVASELAAVMAAAAAKVAAKQADKEQQAAARKAAVAARAAARAAEQAARAAAREADKVARQQRKAAEAAAKLAAREQAQAARAQQVASKEVVAGRSRRSRARITTAGVA